MAKVKKDDPILGHLMAIMAEPSGRAVMKRIIEMSGCEQSPGICENDRVLHLKVGRAQLGFELNQMIDQAKEAFHE